MAGIERLAVGLQITVVGMGLVFLLLALLWLVLTLLLRADTPPAEAPATPAAAPAEPEPAGLPAPLLTAIAVAVLTHRDVQRKQAAPSMRSHWPGSQLFASRWVAAGRHVQNQTWHPRQR